MSSNDVSSKIRIGDVFRVPYGTGLKGSTEPDYVQLTRGSCASGADTQKGIFFYASVDEPTQSFRRLPALIFHTNPYKKDTEGTPWIDVVEQDVGYAIYHCDNKRSGRSPLEARGNRKVVEIQHFYFEPALRLFAPPILVFTQKVIRGTSKSYREFSGYGIPVNCRMTTQQEKKSNRYFTNLSVELALFNLVKENEYFDWAWIDARRNGKLNADQTLTLAPVAWRDWVRNGESAIERCRRNVARNNIVRVKAQMDLSSKEKNILNIVIKYYEEKKHPFEGLASYVAARIVGHGCKRGWVTKRSGDMGIDFVCRLDIGDRGVQLSRAPIVVLGQAKCQKKPIAAPDLARVVSRLQRGWMGVYVTTSCYTEQAQIELAADRYHLVLINGKRLAHELEKATVEEGITLQDLLERETRWYSINERPYTPGRILEESVFSSYADLGQ